VTIRRTASRKGPRWLALLATVMGLSVVLGVATAFAAIPNGYTVVIDEHGANDVPGQVDVTQMGVMASESPDLRIFWSWDSISAWTGAGQTGDACALFDTIGALGDTDAFINYVVCARVNNPTASPTTVQIAPAGANKPVYIFDCSNKKFDRCTNPSPRTYTAGQVLAGPFNTLSQSGAGDLINNSDPFGPSTLNGPGESYNLDSSVDIRIAAALAPAGVKMVNVCSYPSAGNGGNNNPFDCIRTPGAGTLTVVKVLPNNSGGTKAYGDFGFTVGSGSATTGVASSAFDGDGSISVSVTEGTYSVVEVPTSTTGYTTTYANSVNANTDCASLTVTAGGTTTCTITNDDNPGSLQIVKKVTNDNGGMKTVTDFSLGTNAGTLTFDAGSTVGATTTYTATAISVAAGPYTLTEVNVAGYTEGSWSCTGGTASPTTFNAGSVSVANGATVVCTITNNDDAGSLQIVKRVTNDNGGNKTVADFNLDTDATASALAFDAGVADGANTIKYTATAVPVNAGPYTLTESDVTGYGEGTWGCTGATPSSTTYNAGSVTVPNGATVVCTITNDDDAGSLKIVKRVVNDNGGNKAVSDFGLTTNTGTALAFGAGSTVGSTTTYTSQAISVSAGTYTMSENNVAGYTEGSWSCPLGTGVTSTFNAGSVTVPNGVAVVCTITNDDDAGSLQIVKRVVNDNGSIKTVGDFGLDTDATADPLAFDAGSADGANTIKYTATALTVNAGTYSLTESDVAGYTEGSWSCPLGTGVTSTFSAGSVTVPNGVAVVCTITNNDDKALPSGSTAQSYILKDSLLMSGLRTGATTPGTLTFSLWSTKTGDVCSDQVGSDLVVTNIAANTTYAPSSGIAVTDADTYYWTVQYSGDEFNTGFTTACGSESTTISKIE
jgi:hypothetical protein